MLSSGSALISLEGGEVLNMEALLGIDVGKMWVQGDARPL